MVLGQLSVACYGLRQKFQFYQSTASARSCWICCEVVSARRAPAADDGVLWVGYRSANIAVLRVRMTSDARHNSHSRRSVTISSPRNGIASMCQPSLKLTPVTSNKTHHRQSPIYIVDHEKCSRERPSYFASRFSQIFFLRRLCTSVLEASPHDVGSSAIDRKRPLYI